MKNLIKTIFCAAMLALPMARAMAGGGPSISYDQSATVGGVEQKFQNGIGPSDFDAGQIGIRLTQAAMTLCHPPYVVTNCQPAGNSLLDLWAMTPEPLKKPLGEYESRVNASNPNQINIYGGGFYVDPAVQVVTRWAAWASEQGMLDFNYFVNIYNQCRALGGAPGSGGGENMTAQGMTANYLAGCAVRAYIGAYTVDGFTQQHNLKGLVPLCEVQQANSCNILPGFDPKIALQQYQAQKAAERREAANRAAYNAMVMHNKAHARYECMKNVPYGTPITSLTPECKIILGPQVAASIEDAKANGGAK